MWWWWWWWWWWRKLNISEDIGQSQVSLAFDHFDPPFGGEYQNELGIPMKTDHWKEHFTSFHAFSILCLEFIWVYIYDILWYACWDLWVQIVKLFEALQTIQRLGTERVDDAPLARLLRRLFQKSLGERTGSLFLRWTDQGSQYIAVSLETDMWRTASSTVTAWKQASEHVTTCYIHVLSVFHTHSQAIQQYIIAPFFGVCVCVSFCAIRRCTDRLGSTYVKLGQFIARLPQLWINRKTLREDLDWQRSVELAG